VKTERPASQYTLGRRIRETEQAMARAQRHVDRLNEQLVATTDHQQLAELGAELAAGQAELAELEERWLELAEQQSG
jgi:ATP-binding cassette subfamily F protein uup